MIFEDKLSFEFNVFLLEFTIDNVDEDSFFDESHIIISIDDPLLEDVTFKSGILKGYEYLGYREGMENARSISNEMFYFLERIKEFNNNAIDTFFTDVDDGDSYCDSAGNYLFTIEIKYQYWSDLKFAKHIVELINSINISVPKFYTPFFQEEEKIEDSQIVSLISTSTKARRLGYFKVLSSFLETYKKVPYSYLNKKIEDYCLNYSDYLDNNLYKKGLIIKTLSGISAKPYAEVAFSLDILNKINNIVYTGKSFKVYQYLQKEYSNQPNVFKLSTFDKVYFLECILKNDFFYFSNLLEIFFFEKEASYKYVLGHFQKQLTSCLEVYKRQSGYVNRMTLENFDVILKRISSWEKPEVYLEHLLMPRINWMLDLDILTESDNKFTITDIGLKLFTHLSIWNDISTNKVISPIWFIERFMINMFDDCYNNSEIQHPMYNDYVLEKIYEYIDESFDIFKTLAPNRVTASQAVNYTKYKLYLNNGIKRDYQFILDSLSEKEQDRFIFKYQEQYQDGYIQKKHLNG